MSLVASGGGVISRYLTPRNVRFAARLARRAVEHVRQAANQGPPARNARQQQRTRAQRVARQLQFEENRPLNFTAPGRSVMARGRVGRKRRFARKRMSKTRPGLGLKGARLVKMKFCHRITIDLNTGANLADQLNPNVDSTIPRGYKANSISRPAQYAKNPDVVHDPAGTDEALLMYKRYKVLRSTISIQSVRSIEGTMDPLMVGINLTENGANEGATGVGPTAVRGTDLAAVAVKRDNYRQTPGLIGAGKTNIINSSTATRFKWSATYHASRWNKGRHKDDLVLQWADLRDTADFNGNAPRAVALDNLGPKDPTQLVYFQPWACHPTAVAGSTATSNPIECLVTLYYEVLVAERANQPRGEIQ